MELACFVSVDASIFSIAANMRYVVSMLETLRVSGVAVSHSFYALVSGVGCVNILFLLV